MYKHTLRSLIMTAALSAALAGTASADQLWNFSSLFTNAQTNTTLGSTATFTQGSNWLMATAVVPSWTTSGCTAGSTPTGAAPCLFAKDTAGDPTESGLGLQPNTDGEIFYPDGIALQANANNPITSIELGSVQSGESWAVDGCDAMLKSCMMVDSGIGGSSNTQWITGLGSFDTYVAFIPCATGSTCDGSTTSGDNNVLVMSAITSVPEPGTLALFGAGLLGCAIFVGRRRRQQTRA